LTWRNVLPGGLDGGDIKLRRCPSFDNWDLVVALRGIDDGLIDRLGALGGKALQAPERPVVEVVGVGGGGTQGNGDRLHQRHPLAPRVVGGNLADDPDDGVGVTELVGRRFGQAFDFADDVVAQVADKASVQRRQPG
jgi:hypothetical protein